MSLRPLLCAGVNGLHVRAGVLHTRRQASTYRRLCRSLPAPNPTRARHTIAAGPAEPLRRGKDGSQRDAARGCLRELRATLRWRACALCLKVAFLLACDTTASLLLDKAAHDAAGIGAPGLHAGKPTAGPGWR